MRGLRAAREAAMMTQSDLSQKLGVSDVAVSRWETGERDPSTDTVRKLAAILGCSTDSLLAVPDQPEVSAGDQPADQSEQQEVA